MSPGASAEPLASIVVAAPAASRSFALPKPAIFPFRATTVSASRIGRARSPDSISPIFLMTSLPAGPPVLAASAILVLRPGLRAKLRSLPRLRSSRGGQVADGRRGVKAAELRGGLVNDELAGVGAHLRRLEEFALRDADAVPLAVAHGLPATQTPVYLRHPPPPSVP